MKPNKAMRITSYGGPEVMRIDEIGAPALGAGQVLVEVGAAGVNGLDWKIRDGFVQDAFPLQLPAVLGIELAGTVVAVAPDVSRLKIGDRVMGPLAGIGAYAHFVAVDEVKLNITPDGLSDVVAALTAWQALRAAGELRAGQKILIHGAAGGVGGFAVQFAKHAGAEVYATAAASSRDYVLGLGADIVFDRHAQRFEEQLQDVDLVLDLVGGETLDRSWRILAPGGAIVSTAAFDMGSRVPAGKRGIWFMMKPDAANLAEIAKAVEAGRVKSVIAEAVDLYGLAEALERNKTGHGPGKIIVDFSL